jgi:hypothetical protein
VRLSTASRMRPLSTSGSEPVTRSRNHAAGGRQLRAKGQFAKVLVVRDDDALVRLGTGQDCVIRLGAHRLLDRKHVMPRLRNP